MRGDSLHVRAIATSYLKLDLMLSSGEKYAVSELAWATTTSPKQFLTRPCLIAQVAWRVLDSCHANMFHRLPGVDHLPLGSEIPVGTKESLTLAFNGTDCMREAPLKASSYRISANP